MTRSSRPPARATTVRWRWLGALLSMLALHGAAPVWAQPAAASATASAAASEVPATAEDTPANVVVVNHRRILSFRASVLGRTPRERALAANVAVGVVLERGGAGKVTVWQSEKTRTAGLQIDGLMVLYLVPEDLDAGSDLFAAIDAARIRLQAAVNELRETRDPRRIAIGVAYSVAATLIAYLLLRGAFALRRRVLSHVSAVVDRWQPEQGRSLIATYGQHARSIALGATLVVTWGFVLLVIDVWATFVLRQFAYTRAWGERSTEWIIGLLGEMGAATLEAVPGLLTALLIFFIARLVTRINSVLLQRIERGELEVSWVDRDTAGPTRRVGNFVVWLFALALAYPFLPGSNSDAFKGVSVLAGLMLSLGASGVVGQIMSGLSLMYSRTLRVGEFVKVGGIEGTVASIGMFTTKLHTGLGEEVSMPNTALVSQPVQNYSRLARGKFVLSVAVTIGYATPWRQVHAMLLEAARRTQGVAEEPPPYVMQTALADFYVEYRLCAQSSALAPARRAEALSRLNGHVQDVFNENGVQIMSPHYIADPPQPQVVPPQGWSPGLAPAARAPQNEPP